MKWCGDQKIIKKAIELIDCKNIRIKNITLIENLVKDDRVILLYAIFMKENL